MQGGLAGGLQDGQWRRRGPREKALHLRLLLKRGRAILRLLLLLNEPEIEAQLLTRMLLLCLLRELQPMPLTMIRRGGTLLTSVQPIVKKREKAKLRIRTTPATETATVVLALADVRSLRLPLLLLQLMHPGKEGATAAPAAIAVAPAAAAAAAAVAVVVVALLRTKT